MSNNTTLQTTPLAKAPAHKYVLEDVEYKCLESNLEAVQLHADKGVEVFSTSVVKDGEEVRTRYWVKADEYVGRVTKAERTKRALIDGMIAQGLTEAQAEAVLATLAK